MASNMDLRLAIHVKLKQDIYNEFDTDSDEYENLVHQMLLSGVGKGLLKRKRSLHDKFEALENKGLLGINKYDFLKKIATSSGNEWILAYIKKAEDDLQTMQTGTVSAVLQETKDTLTLFYQKHCQRLPIYPLKPFVKHRIDKVYVKPHMIVVDPRGIHVNSSREFHKTKLREVDKLKDIFYSEDTLCKEIYIEGDMGMGKSSLCEHLVNLWVRSQTGQRPLLEDESFMSSFTFLFYISLTEANKTFKQRHRIEDMIKHQLQLKDVDVAKLMSEYSCLILLDGLDSLTGETDAEVSRFGSKHLPERLLRDNKCVYMTTSRPFKLEFLARELEGKVDRKIYIKGLEEASYRELTTNVINVLNSENRCNENRTPDMFIQYIQMQGMSEYLETPMLCMYILCLWFDGKSVGKSQCDIYSSIIELLIEHTQDIRNLSIEEHSNHGNHPLPMCLTKLPYCNKYTYLLHKASKLAYVSLFDKNQEIPHDHTAISNLSDEELKQLLEFGIRTQHKVFGGITDMLKSIYFPYKGQKEFLCAVYLTSESETSSLSKLLSGVIFDLNRMPALEQILLFVCGLTAEGATELSSCILQLFSSDARIQVYRRVNGGHHMGKIIERTQYILVAGMVEARKNHYTSSVPKLPDIYASGWQDVSKIKNIFSCDRSQVKYIGFDVPGNAIRSWPTSRYVEKIHLRAVDMSLCDIFNCKFSSYHLSMLCLNQVVMTNMQIECLCANLSSSSKLEEVLLIDISCISQANTRDNCNIQLNVSKHTQLKTLSLEIGLKIKELSFGNENKNLKTIHLGAYRFKGECLPISAKGFKRTIESLPRNGVMLTMNDVSLRGVDMARHIFEKMINFAITSTGGTHNVRYREKDAIVGNFTLYTSFKEFNQAIFPYEAHMMPEYVRKYRRYLQ